MITYILYFLLQGASLLSFSRVFLNVIQISDFMVITLQISFALTFSVQA